MPELPEVRTTAKYLNESVKNKTITNILVNNPKLIKEVGVPAFKLALIGQKIASVENVGKFIAFYFQNSNLVLLSHLRMEGKYHFEEWKNNAHDHVVFFLDKTPLFYNDTRQFGTFHLRDKNTMLSIAPLNKLGPEPQNADAQVVFKALSKKSLAIKTALLDQSLICGLGNIYVNEVLWDIKMHPQLPSKMVNLKDVHEILASSAKILDLSTKMGGTTIRSYTSLDDKEGSFQTMLKVHDKAGKQCPRCGATIKKIKVNGRGTYFCPNDQKLPH